MMVGRLLLLAALVALLALGGVYATKFEAHRLRAELASLQRAAVAERRRLQALRAEWAYLNRPQRLADLAERYLPELAPATPERIMALGEVAREHEAARTPPLAALLPSGAAVSLRLKPTPPRFMATLGPAP